MIKYVRANSRNFRTVNGMKSYRLQKNTAKTAIFFRDFTRDLLKQTFEMSNSLF